MPAMPDPADNAHVATADAAAAAAAAARPGSNVREFSVSELSAALKRTVEDSYGYIRVRGEISQPKRHSSGHVYLRLKDDSAVLDGVCWRGTAARLAVRPEEGMEVVCTGRLTTYAARSSYQLVIESMELAGEGALLKLLEERRKRLAAEGLFDAERKRKVPHLPEVIGVITSPTGAVIRDILHRLADRFPRHVLLWPVAVQGAGAAEQVAEAIAGFDALAPAGPVPRPDVLIVARGGGSLEDLMPFNEEAVVRAAAACRIPLISAVGHETDTTLIDHAADLRAPTPTAAAELAVPVRAELQADVLDRARRLVGAWARLGADRRLRLDGLGRGLGDPRRLLEGAAQRLDDRAERWQRALPQLVERRRAALAELAGRLRHPKQQLAEARRHLDTAGERLEACGKAQPRRARERFAPLAARFDHAPVARAVQLQRARVLECGGRLAPAAQRRLADGRARLAGLGQLLESYSYKDVLRRGFALVRDAAGEPVTDGAGLAEGRALEIEFRDEARVGAVVTGPAASAGVREPRPPRARQRAEPSPRAPDRTKQGSLF
jgi:exodeoxyribonuclease VII large subunit